MWSLRNAQSRWCCPMLFTAMLLFSLTTAVRDFLLPWFIPLHIMKQHWVADIIRAYPAFITNSKSGINLKRLTDCSHPLSVLKNVIVRIHRLLYRTQLNPFIKAAGSNNDRGCIHCRSPFLHIPSSHTFHRSSDSFSFGTKDGYLPLPPLLY